MNVHAPTRGNFINFPNLPSFESLLKIIMSDWDKLKFSLNLKLTKWINHYIHLPIVIKLFQLLDVSRNFENCVGSFLLGYVKCIGKVLATAIDRLHFFVIENVFFL